MPTITNGTDYNQPQPQHKVTAANYMSGYDFANKYIPDTKAEVIARYNNGILGFIDAFGKPIPVGADKYYWAESGRLLPKLKGVTLSGTTFTAPVDAPLKVGQKVLVSNPAEGGKYAIGRVQAVNGKTFEAIPYGADAWDANLTGAESLVVICTGSDFPKGSDKMDGALEGVEDIYSTTMHISKDSYEVNGSDVTSPTWYQTPDGGYVWNTYESEQAFKRFMNSIELDMLTSVPVVNTTLKDARLNSGNGIFGQIRERGNTVAGMPTTLADWEDIVKMIDKVQGESYNAIFCTTDFALTTDHMLANANRYSENTQNWGAFSNKDNAIQFGFDSFSIGGKTFYKNTWKVLTDPTALAPENFSASSVINGLMMPMGNINVKGGYQSALSESPVQSVNYLNTLYRAGNGYNRLLVTKPYGDTPGDTRDIIGISWLTERGVMLVAANRWAIFEG